MEELGKKKVEGLSLEELEAQRVELLPDREEMQPTVTNTAATAQAGAVSVFGDADAAATATA